MRLEQWGIIQVPSSPYEAPEQRKMQVTGNVYGHPNPNWEDGHGITTSNIVKIQDSIAYTRSGSEYELGEVDPEYEKMFPNALEKSFRLMNEYLDNVSDEEFLKTYLEIEKDCDPNGITIDEYLRINNESRKSKSGDGISR